MRFANSKRAARKRESEDDPQAQSENGPGQRARDGLTQGERPLSERANRPLPQPPISTMLSLFRRKRPPPAPTRLTEPLVKGLIRPESAAALLATPRRQRLLGQIWQRTALSREQFGRLYRAPLERYAGLVQQFPASEAHHHAYLGGMLDHGLEIVAIALKLRQAHLLPAGAPPETQAAEAEAWTAGTAYAALLHDIGKIAVDIHVEYGDSTRWHPWHGPLARPYRFRYRPDRTYRLHSAAAGLLYTDILETPIIDWLSGYSDLWPALLYVLAGQYEHAGILGELVVQADRASVAQALGGDPAKVKEAPQQALQRKLLDGLRYLVRGVLRLNQPEASDGWLTQDALWLVSKTVCDRLRAHLLSQGIEGIPERNTAVFDVLQEHGIVQQTPDGKAIWRATITSDTGWTHAFTFLRLSPALIWDASERPASFNGTVFVSNPATAEPSTEVSAPISDPTDFAAAELTPEGVVGNTCPPKPVGNGLDSLDHAQPLSTSLDVTSAPAYARSSPQATRSLPLVDRLSMTETTGSSSGESFFLWLREAIRSHRLIINDAKALVHTLAGTAFLVSPGVFKRYVEEHPDAVQDAPDALGGWPFIQKQFERLQIHKRGPDRRNIWTCQVVGSRRSRHLHGYLLLDPSTIFDVTPIDNPFLQLLGERVDVGEKHEIESPTVT